MITCSSVSDTCSSYCTVTFFKHWIFSHRSNCLPGTIKMLLLLSIWARNKNTTALVWGLSPDFTVLLQTMLMCTATCSMADSSLLSHFCVIFVSVWSGTEGNKSPYVACILKKKRRASVSSSAKEGTSRDGVLPGLIYLSSHSDTWSYDWEHHSWNWNSV